MAQINPFAPAVPVFSVGAGPQPVPVFAADLTVKSSFAANIKMFDGEEDHKISMPDLDFVVPGMGAPLKLHRCLLCVASSLVHDVLALKPEKDRGRFVWPFDTETKKDREALVKALRFCYGGTLTLESPKQVCAVIAAINRLQVRNATSVIAKLKRIALEAAHGEAGLEILRECLKYEECCRARCVQLDALVLEKLLPALKAVPEDILKKLQPCCVDAVKYQDVHSEFLLRMSAAAIKEDAQSKRSFMDKMDTSRCSAAELAQLNEMGIYTKEEMLAKYAEALAARDKNESNGQAYPRMVTFAAV